MTEDNGQGLPLLKAASRKQRSEEPKWCYECEDFFYESLYDECPFCKEFSKEDNS